MADVTISVQNIRRGGITPSLSSGLNAGDTHLVRNDGRVFLWVKNGDTSDHTATVATPFSRSGLDLADLTVTVTAGGEAFIGPFERSTFNNADDDLAVTFDATTSVELGAFRV